LTRKVKIDNIAIGKRIREEREKLELSREEFAEIVELSDYYIGQLERGERQMSLPVLVNIADCLHISLDYLIFGKIPTSEGLVCETQDIYETDGKLSKINDLLKKCSDKELELISKLIKTIIPYIGKN